MSLGRLLGYTGVAESLPHAMNRLAVERNATPPVHHDPLAEAIAEQKAHERQVTQEFEEVLLAKAYDHDDPERAQRLRQAREELRKNG